MNNKFCILISLMSSVAMADLGDCIALGRVHGEDKICAQYTDTSIEMCKKADGHAWCGWQQLDTRGSGPIQAVCSDENAKRSIYNVNEVHYFENNEVELIGRGFGPNRGDEGIVVLKGTCHIRVR